MNPPVPEALAHQQQQHMLMGRSISFASEAPNIIEEGNMVNGNVEDCKEEAEGQAPVRRSEQERRDAAER